MTNPLPDTRPANARQLASARGELFLFGHGIDRTDERRLRFWDERDARTWLCQFAENSAALRTVAATSGLWGDLAGYPDDIVLDLLANSLANGRLGVMRAQAVRTRALQTRVPEPEEVTSVAPSKPVESWIRLDCDTVLEKPIGVSVGDDAGSGIRVSTKLNAAA